MGLEARKCKEDQNIKVGDLRLLDFKNVSKSHRRWRFYSTVRATRWKSKTLQISRKF